MCVYSMVVDHYTSKPWPQIGSSLPVTSPEITRAREILKEMEELLKKAKAYDIANKEPDCELDSKKDALRKIAEGLGVEIQFP